MYWLGAKPVHAILRPTRVVYVEIEISVHRIRLNECTLDTGNKRRGPPTVALYMDFLRWVYQGKMDFLRYEKMHAPLQFKYKRLLKSCFGVPFPRAQEQMRIVYDNYFVFKLQGYMHLLIAQKVHFAFIYPSQKVHI